MALDLEALRVDLEAYLEKSGFAVFYGYHRMADTLNQVEWDSELRPDYREFLRAAEKAGAKLIVFHHHAFSLDQIDDALDELEDSDLPREDKRSFERRLRELRAYEGFTCSVELSFSVDSLIYIYEKHTEWYSALNEILAELDAITEEEEEDDDTLGGYFSKN
jgi:hypothetical protein